MRTTENEARLFVISKRYLRSTVLERDWQDKEALEDYVVTPLAAQTASKLAAGLRPTSSLRAWRITGDYGSGKSSFALLIANLFSKRFSELPANIREGVGGIGEFRHRRQRQQLLLPVLVTGSRSAMSLAILRGLAAALDGGPLSKRLLKELGEFIERPGQVDDATAIHWINRIRKHVVNKGIAQGIILILDEAGKFLEFAAMQPEQQDVFLLQSLAELASRSGENPIYIITLFHQGISAYTGHLTKSQNREWEKVAGRFEEINWHYPVEQIASLVVHSLNTRTELVSAKQKATIEDDMGRALRLGWYGADANRESLEELADGLYPIHPTVLPILVRLFSSFGQNERSLFSFILGEEPNSLQSFVAKTGGTEFFRLHHLFDYAKSSLGNKISTFELLLESN